MKKFRNAFLISIFMIIIAFASALAIPRPAKTQQTNASSQNISAAFDYVTLTQAKQVLNIKNLASYKDESGATVRNIISNKNTNFNFFPLKYNYKIDSTEWDNYYVDKEVITFTTTETTADGEWIFRDENSTFNFDGQEYRYGLTTDKTNDGIDDRLVEIFKVETVANNSPVVTEAKSQLLSFEETVTYDGGDPVSATRTITIIKTITPQISLLLAKEFSFSVVIGNTSPTYTFTFEEPITDFEQNSPVLFSSLFDGSGNPSRLTNKITSEETHNKMQIDFVNNNYTQFNPLYFDINYNGFVYNFKLYTKEFLGKNYLFVNYFDTDKEVDKKKFVTENQQKLAKTGTLATPLRLEDDKFTVNLTDSSKIVYSTDNFSLSFSHPGRYSIEIYDSTHLLGLNNKNYYQTSFYIRKDVGGTASADNIYIVAESVDEEFNHKEYIVSRAVLNNNIKFSIKNLTTDHEALEKIVITKTIFGNEENVPVPTTYTVEELLSSLENGDFVMRCTEDASYTIDIYEKGNSTPVKYQYTVLKNAKSQFSDPDVGGYTEHSPYTKTNKNYSKKISNTINLNIRINNSVVNDYVPNMPLNKTYIDHFKVTYGKIQVDFQEIKQYDDEGKEIKTDAKTYQFFGVGDITLFITFNGETTTKVLKEKESHSVTFSEYGKYTVQMKDEMGTQLTTPLSFKVVKSLNTSALVLIILISIVVAAVTIFIILSRTKIATR